MQHIETVTVGAGGTSSITFMSVGDIPSEYTDLLVVYSLRSTIAGEYVNVGFRFNGDTGSNYSVRLLYGLGSGSGASAAATSTLMQYHYATGSTATASTFGNGSFYIPNYRSSVAKSTSGDSVSENNATTAIQALTAGLWTGTDPITSITIIPQPGGNFVEHSSASLYGVLAGSDGIVSVS